MRFVEKVEAATKNSVIKPAKVSKPKSPGSVAKPAKASKPAKAKKFGKVGAKPKLALGKDVAVNTSLQRVKAALPKFIKMLTVANPFDKPGPGKLGDSTWAKFFALAAPEILTLLLWDMGEIERTDVPAFRRLFKQRVKPI